MENVQERDDADDLDDDDDELDDRMDDGGRLTAQDLANAYKQDQTAAETGAGGAIADGDNGGTT